MTERREDETAASQDDAQERGSTLLLLDEMRASPRAPMRRLLGTSCERRGAAQASARFAAAAGVSGRPLMGATRRLSNVTAPWGDLRNRRLRPASAGQSSGAAPAARSG
jgi:hypothetical protein